MSLRLIRKIARGSGLVVPTKKTHRGCAGSQSDESNEGEAGHNGFCIDKRFTFQVRIHYEPTELRRNLHGQGVRQRGKSAQCREA